MTHEFKTPLATISLAVDALKNDKVKNDETKKDYFIGVIKEENKLEYIPNCIWLINSFYSFNVNNKFISINK